MMRIGVLPVRSERDFPRPSSHFHLKIVACLNPSPSPRFLDGAGMELRTAVTIALNLFEPGETKYNSILPKCNHREVIPMALRPQSSSPRIICQGSASLASV